MKIFEDVRFWYENSPAFANIFDDPAIKAVFQGWEYDEILQLFVDDFEERLIYKKYDTENPLGINETTCIRIASYISRFFKSAQYKFQTLIDSLGYDYDPIRNYNITSDKDVLRTPNLTETTERTLKDSGTDTHTKDGTETHKKTGNDTLEKTGTVSDSGNTTNTGSVTTFDNTNTFNNSDKVAVTGSNTTTNDLTDTQNYNSTDTINYDISDTNTLNLTHSTDETRKTSGSEHETTNQTFVGNIGNILTQDMIKAERKIADINVVRLFLQNVADMICLYTYD